MFVANFCTYDDHGCHPLHLLLRCDKHSMIRTTKSDNSEEQSERHTRDNTGHRGKQEDKAQQVKPAEENDDLPF